MEATFNANQLDSRQDSKTVRLAASLFFLVCIPAVSWGQGYVLSKIWVPGDATATVNNLLSNEFIFRTGIVTHLVSVVTFACIALLFHRVFRPVDKHLSRMMVVSALLQVGIFFILELFNITALMTLKGDMVAFDVAQKNELSFLLLRMHRYGIGAAQIFWGLWMLPLGILIYKSGFAPRILGVFAIIGGVGYVAEGCVFILLQRADYLMVRQFLKFTYMFGLSGPMLWFLIKGVGKKEPMISKT